MANESQIGKDTVKNMFTNDGSFLEMFRKHMQSRQNLKESTKQTETDETSTNVHESASHASREEKQKTESESTDTTKLNMPIVGKRRGSSKTLKTGIVMKKPKQESMDDKTSDKDGWSKYLDEVNKYKSKMCIDDDKSRPLVK